MENENHLFGDQNNSDSDYGLLALSEIFCELEEMEKHRPTIIEESGLERSVSLPKKPRTSKTVISAAMSNRISIKTLTTNDIRAHTHSFSTIHTQPNSFQSLKVRTPIRSEKNRDNRKRVQKGLTLTLSTSRALSECNSTPRSIPMPPTPKQ